MNRDLTREANIWTSRYYNQPGNPEFCRAACHKDYSSWQCPRKPSVFRELDHPKGTFGFCGQHDPVKVEERRAARDAKWKKQWEATQAGWKAAEDRKKVTAECIEALRTIEAGHNDPRALAREVLAKLDAIPKGGK